MARYCPLWHWPFLSTRPHGFKTRLTRERYPHPYKACFVPLSSRCGISQSTPLGAQRPRWHTDLGPALIPSVTSQVPTWHDIVRFGTGPSSPPGLTALKRVIPGRGIHTLIKACFVPLSSRCGISQFSFSHMANKQTRHVSFSP